METILRRDVSQSEGIPAQRAQAIHLVKMAMDRALLSLATIPL